MRGRIDLPSIVEDEYASIHAASDIRAEKDLDQWNGIAAIACMSLFGGRFDVFPRPRYRILERTALEERFPLPPVF